MYHLLWFRSLTAVVLLDETVLQSFMVIMAHGRIPTISQNHSLRFLSVHPAKQLALHVSCPWWRWNRRAHLWYCSAGRSDNPDASGQSLLGKLEVFVSVWLYMHAQICVCVLFILCPLWQITERDGTKKTCNPATTKDSHTITVWFL